MVNYTRLQSLADKLIKNFGGGSENASLRRAAVDRPCSVVILTFLNQEVRNNHLLQYTDKNVYVSAKGLTTPPDNELDTIILSGVEHKIVQPPTPLSPDGEIVVYWQVAARL
jgi:hypothetical protein